MDGVTTMSNLVRLYMNANRNEPPLPLNEDSSDASLDLLISRIEADKKANPEKYARRFRENLERARERMDAQQE